VEGFAARPNPGQEPLGARPVRTLAAGSVRSTALLHTRLAPLHGQLTTRRPRRYQEQEHRGRVEQQRNHENEPSQDRLAVGAKQRRQIPYLALVALDSAALAIYGGLLDLEVDEMNHDGGPGVKPEGARTSAPVGG
jgi:hypothetical protein